MADAIVAIQVAAPLRFFVPARRRAPRVEVAYDATSTIGHLVSSLGVPLPEVGRLAVGGAQVSPAYRPQPGDLVVVAPVRRPQPLPGGRARFLLDVHLGSLARRMRLLGIDTRYERDIDDDELARLAPEDDRVLLTQDRGLLHRTAIRERAAYVRGSGADEQLVDVLDRFALATAPFTRCLACNGLLAAASKQDVLPVLEPGTARTYDDFVRCQACGHVYWRGAHARQLDALVAAART
ncbi:MAG TPA: Mut7-C RNAse domain-containing protein [Nocardioidaceae bacterium]